MLYAVLQEVRRLLIIVTKIYISDIKVVNFVSMENIFVNDKYGCGS